MMGRSVVRRAGVLLEMLEPGVRIDGLVPGQSLTILATQSHGADAVEITYKDAAGRLGQQVVFRSDEGSLREIGRAHV